MLFIVGIITFHLYHGYFGSNLFSVPVFFSFLVDMIITLKSKVTISSFM